MLLFLALTCCSIEIIFLIIIHIARHSENKIIPVMKMSITPLIIVGTVPSFFIIQMTWVGVVIILITLMTIIFAHEGYIHHILLKKGYPIPKEEQWFLMPIKEVKKLPEMAPGFKREAKDFLLRKIFLNT